MVISVIYRLDTGGHIHSFFDFFLYAPIFLWVGFRNGIHCVDDCRLSALFTISVMPLSLDLRLDSVSMETKAYAQEGGRREGFERHCR